MRQTLLLMILILAATACGGSGDASQAGADRGDSDSLAFRVAVLPTLDCLPLFLAAEHGMFQRSGVDVRLVDYQAQMDCDTAVAGGSVAAVMTDLVRVERLRRQGTPLDYLTSTEASWQLMTSRTARIRQLRQLDDKMLSMTRYSATDMLGDMAVDSVRLADERVFRIQVNDLSVRLNMLQTGIMDAALLPEPQATAARNQRAFALLDASRAFDLRLGVLAMREKTLDSLRQTAFLRAYDEACDSLNAHGLKAYRELIVRRTGVGNKTVDSLPDHYSFRHAAPPREQDMSRAAEWLREKTEKADVEKQPIQ